jgi:hypothetical protein
MMLRFSISKWSYRIHFTAVYLAIAGCSGRPSRVEAPSWDPSGFADAVLEKLDKNGDSLVGKDEISAAPGLAFGARFIDKDGDEQLSREELVARFAMYRDRRIGLTSKMFRVTHNDRPLVGADIRLVPEFFLTDVEPASGTTDESGIVQPYIEGEQYAVMRVGYYRVEVRSPRVELPPKFNTQTTLGVEVSPMADDPSTEGTIEIQLRDSKRS